MLPFAAKRSFNQSQQNDNSLQKTPHQSIESQSHFHNQSKRNSEMSILEKLNSFKVNNIQDIDISLKLHKNFSYRNDSQFFVLGKDFPTCQFQSKTHNNNQLQRQSQPINNQNFTSSRLMFSKTKIQPNLKGVKKPQNEKQNIGNKMPTRQTYLNPTQSWSQKLTPEKSIKKSQNRPTHSQNPNQRQLLTALSIHQQLYLESRRKQLKRSAEQIIQNEYFKKVHPFKPSINEVSEFLAEEKRQKINQIQRFQKQFQQFQNWKQQRKNSQDKSVQLRKRQKKDLLDLQNHKKTQQNQAELKKYTLLKQFFYYLSENSSNLTYQNLLPKKLFELPEPCITLLEPILEDFYKNKKSKKLSWLQFLSEFNIKVSKKKAFYALIEKWFKVKFSVRFDHNCKQSYDFEWKNNEDKIKTQQDSTFIGHSSFYQDGHSTRTKIAKNPQFD